MAATLRRSRLIAIVCLAAASASVFAHADEPTPDVAALAADGNGNFTRPLGLDDAEAQQAFDQGLLLLYAFNHDEAIVAFERAAQLAPRAAAPRWGLALAHGPHINKIGMTAEQSQAAWQALQNAVACAAQGSDVDRALISALQCRYAAEPPADRTSLDRAYANAMREAWRAFPHDGDVGALFAESLMDLRPWELWTVEGQPQPGTTEVLEVLEQTLAEHPQHPLALHLYVHAVEASPAPERGDAAADRLREAHPALGHLVHMPSHIDIRRGRWGAALTANERAIAADERLQQRRSVKGFYRIYMAHNRHMLAFAAMMRGESRRSAAAIDELLAGIPQDWLAKPENAALVDGYFAMPIEIDMRFGRWQNVLDRPQLKPQYPLAGAIRLAARGVALAALNRPEAARQEQAAFRQARQLVPAEAGFGNNTAANLLAVADALLEGELLLREGDIERGLAELERAAEREDQLRYDEPPDWVQPVRHAWGAALVRHGRSREAEVVYQQDLTRWPENGWSLFGLAESLRQQGRIEEAQAVDARFKAAWQAADVTLSASCYCQATPSPSGQTPVLPGR